MSSLEHGLFRVPYEQLGRLHRNNQKIAAAHLESAYEALDQLSQTRGFEDQGAVPVSELGLTAKAQALKSVQAMIEQLESLKGKLESSALLADRGVSRLRSRVCHLYQLECVDRDLASSAPQSGSEMDDDPDEKEEADAREAKRGRLAEPQALAEAQATRSEKGGISDHQFSPSRISSSGRDLVCSGTGRRCAVHSQPPEFVIGPGSIRGVHSATGIRFYRVLVDHLFREGMYQTASELATQARLLKLVDLDVYASAKRIADSLDQKTCSKALQWCAANRAGLQKIGSRLEFELHSQVFLDLLSQGKTVEAIQYSQEQLSAFAARHLQDMQVLMMAVTFPQVQLAQAGRGNEVSAAPQRQPSRPVPSFVREQIAPFFSPSRWTFLQKMFKQDHAAVNGLTANSLLSISLQTGLSALKTSFCEQPDARRRNCPGCASTFSPITKAVPVAERQHSSLVCRLSGDVMDENNCPLVLPSGEIYSKNALTQIADAQEGLLVEFEGKNLYLGDCRPAYLVR